MKQSDAGLLSTKNSALPQLFLGLFACVAGSGGIILIFLDGAQDLAWSLPVAACSVGTFVYGVSLLKSARITRL
jgi:hypothetical protein